MSDDHNLKAPAKRPLPKSRPSFLTRTATDDASQLETWATGQPSVAGEIPSKQYSNVFNGQYEPQPVISNSEPHRPSLARKLLASFDSGSGQSSGRRGSSGRKRHSHAPFDSSSHTAQASRKTQNKDKADGKTSLRVGTVPRSFGGQAKLGTFSGVFVPTTLNVLSILMFLRFGFILGQSGVLGMMGMLIVSYVINLVTTLSVSAISTNGTVRGGGAYYLISRSLGPEFGGSIGIVFYLGSVFNTGMNAVGLIDCLKQNFGSKVGNWAQWLPEGFWLEYLWATAILLVCTAICLAGSSFFARCSNGLLAILLVATFSIPFSSFIVSPFRNHKLGIEYTGLSAQTFMSNLFPKLTRGAAGSQLHHRENFQDLFGILFPATGGIFAGASMSGDLKDPSRAIPKGTLSGLALTFVAYVTVVFAMAAAITRETFYRNVNVIQDTNLSGVLILLGEFATSFFSSLMGVIGSAKLLQALARDNLLPGFSIFGQGTESSDEPQVAILFTYFVAQLTMLCNINQIASLVTMTYLMTFLVTNLACFLLRVSSAPNFRPSFHYFNWETAAFGTIISIASMFFVDGLQASASFMFLILIFLIIHYTAPPKSWGDVSQSLIYHQVRRYLLILRRRQEHVKFWRPQILLFINDPRHQFKVIQFCNSLKKGALFILGHVIIADDLEGFGASVPEARRQQKSFYDLIDLSKIKAFVSITISLTVEWGVRNIVLSAGLGGMRPNLVVVGFYNLDDLRKNQSLIEVPSAPPSRPMSRSDLPQLGKNYTTRIKNYLEKPVFLPTDTCRAEGGLGPASYVTILEDLLLRLRINVIVTKGLDSLELPNPKAGNIKTYIDLWPIQMSAEIVTEGGEESPNILTTNFDTYMLILQLGCILNTVPSWKKAYKLRVAVFVEYESDVEEERSRVQTLLSNLRIEAEVLVFWLASGNVKTYQGIVNGIYPSSGDDVEKTVDDVLKNEQWWQDMQKLRGRRGQKSAKEDLADIEGLPYPRINEPSKQESTAEDVEELKNLVRRSQRRRSPNNLHSLGVRLGMTTGRLHDDLLRQHESYASDSEDFSNSSSDEGGSEYDSEADASCSSKASAASENDARELGRGANTGFTRTISASAFERRYSEGGLFGKLTRKRTKARKSRVTTKSSRHLGDSRASPDLSNIRKSVNPKDFSSSVINSGQGTFTRPRSKRYPSARKSISSPALKTVVSTQENSDPSPFLAGASTPQQIFSRQPFYQRIPSTDSARAAASGFPAQQSVPLSFNNIPCRAQHLILNELIRQHSQDTAVVFTTLPSPVAGTCKSEEDSVSYLTDLEVLVQDLPPVCLVQSNSLTVTTSL